MKARVATVWMGGCSGCHMSFLDMDERLLDLAGRIDLVFSPIADAKEFPDDVALTLVEGAVCNEEHLEMAHRVRERSRLVVAARLARGTIRSLNTKVSKLIARASAITATLGTPARAMAADRATSWLRPPLPLPRTVTVVSPPITRQAGGGKGSPCARIPLASAAATCPTSR